MRRDEIIARLRKVAALAARGEGGEAANAEALLDAIAAAHGIDLDELELDDIRERVIPVGRETWRSRLLCQILWTRFPGRDFDFVVERRPVKQRRGMRTGKVRFVLTGLQARLTAAQHVECLSVFEILQRDYERQLKAFFRAFLLKNDLLCPYDPDATKPTPEQERLNEDARRLATGVVRSELYPELDFEDVAAGGKKLD